MLDNMISREDLMDDERTICSPLYLLFAEDLAERFPERDTRGLFERAATDRDWTYRHVVVDEAQELCRNGLAGADAALPKPIFHSGR